MRIVIPKNVTHLTHRKVHFQSHEPLHRWCRIGRRSGPGPKCVVSAPPESSFQHAASSFSPLVISRMQRTYEPLPYPLEDRSKGFIQYGKILPRLAPPRDSNPPCFPSFCWNLIRLCTEGSDWSGRTRRLLVIGDSLVRGIAPLPSFSFLPSLLELASLPLTRLCRADQFACLHLCGVLSFAGAGSGLQSCPNAG